MNIAVTYYDARTGQSQTQAFSPDLLGTYVLPLLADHQPATLRLLPVNSLQQLPMKDRRFYMPNPETGLRLHVPHNWKKPHLTVLLAETSHVPKHLLFVVATAEPMDGKDVLSLIDSQSAELPLMCGYLTHIALYPNLPFRKDLQAAA